MEDSPSPHPRPDGTAPPARDSARTRQRILDAARAEFSAKGLSGGRINTVAEQAGVNKQLIYYYFGGKDQLYGEVLERAYREIREREKALDLDSLPPAEALASFVHFNFDYIVENTYFVALLNDENLHMARHARVDTRIPALQETLKRTLGSVLKRGLEDGTFRRDADPVELYISIASLCYFFLSNRHTLSVIFETDVTADERVAARRAHVTDMILSYLRGAPTAGPADASRGG